jgi:hypothetical protein
LAFFHIEWGITQHIRQKFEPSEAVMGYDRENRSEGGLQTFVLPLRRYFVSLQEALVGLELCSQQEGNVVNVSALRE